MIEVTSFDTFTFFYMKPRCANWFEDIVSPIVTAAVPGAEYTWNYKKGEWDGKSTLMDRRSLGEHIEYAIPTGLMNSVLPLLVERITNVADGRLFGRNTAQRLAPTKVPLRDYQHEGVKRAFSNKMPYFGWWPRGVIQVATGGGKTEMAVAMHEMAGVNSMFLVHRKDLLVQAAERFEKYGHTVGIIGDSKFRPNKNITIATMQTLSSIFQNDSDHRFSETKLLCETVGQLFLDEAHLMASSLDKGNQFVKLVNDNFARCSMRWGLTATPFMRDRYDNLLLEGVTGDLLYRITNEELISRGYLTPPKIRMLTVPGKLEVNRPQTRGRKNIAGVMWRSIQDKGIRFNQTRNTMIADELQTGPWPILCLVATVEQGKFIQDILKTRKGITPLLLTGKTKTSDRVDAVNRLRDGTLPAIITTTIFDEGVDIPELRKVILASGGKSQVKLLQRIGRGLRLSEGKEEVEIIDFRDKHHAKLLEHTRERMKRYREEGFEVVEG